MFNLIAILITFPLLAYTAYVDVTRKDHLIPGWPWAILTLAGALLLWFRLPTWSILDTATALYGIGFTFLCCYLIHRMKNPEGKPQLGGGDFKAFICISLLFPINLIPIFAMLFAVIPATILRYLSSIGVLSHHFDVIVQTRSGIVSTVFLPHILVGLPFAIITGMTLF